MGSFFAGVKAGTLGGVAYLGGLAACNVLLLYAFKPEVLDLIRKSYAQVCASASSAAPSQGAIDSCFSSVVVVYIPLIAFLGFFVALVYSGVFGALYERFPGRSAAAKGEVIAVAVGATLLLLNLTGIYFSYEAKLITVSFLVVWTGVYGLIMGKLYRRYTREVQFVSQDQGALRIMVDNRDCTGKTRTFAAKSTHEVRAQAVSGSSFKGWSVSGGVTVEDPKSFETSMEVEGDGLLKATFAKIH